MEITPDATGLISKEDQIDAFVISTVTILARKYGITVEIDPINGIRNYNGGNADDIKRLKQDISDTLQRYLV